MLRKFAGPMEFTLAENLMIYCGLIAFVAGIILLITGLAYLISKSMKSSSSSTLLKATKVCTFVFVITALAALLIFIS